VAICCQKPIQVDLKSLVPPAVPLPRMRVGYCRWPRAVLGVVEATFCLGKPRGSHRTAVCRGSPHRSVCCFRQAVGERPVCGRDRHDETTGQGTGRGVSRTEGPPQVRSTARLREPRCASGKSRRAAPSCGSHCLDIPRLHTGRQQTLILILYGPKTPHPAQCGLNHVPGRSAFPCKWLAQRRAGNLQSSILTLPERVRCTRPL